MSEAPRIAGPITQRDREEFYDLSGTDAEALRNGIRRWGAAHGDAQMAARTTAEFKTRFKYQEATGACRISDIGLELEIVTALPRWDAPKTADPELQRRWRAFDKAIRLHEHGHHDYAIQQARDLMAALQSLRVERCDQVGSAIKQATDRINAHYRDLNEAYDRKTGHGRSQGAFL